MKDLDKIAKRFRSFGGWRLVGLYLRWGLTWVIIRETLRCLLRRKSLKTVYGPVLRRVEPRLLARYADTVAQAVERVGSERTTDTSPARTGDAPVRVWWCWLQGEEHAPAVAKECLESLRAGLRDATVEVVTMDNYHQWVDIPQYIEEKYRRGSMPPALFSDILRLALLIRYGGVWIDSTVMYLHDDSDTDSGTPYTPSWQEISDADLFVFRYDRRGDGWRGVISNWYIAAHPGNGLLCVLYEVLLAYWRDFDCTADYYIFHLFFKEISRYFPEMTASMPYGSSRACLVLMRRHGQPLTEALRLKACTASHWQKRGYR